MAKQTDPTEELRAYIALLEETNYQLILVLKKTVELLRQSTSELPNEKFWSDMIRDFERVIALGEKRIVKRNEH